MLNFRADKKTQNEDDFRVLLAGSVLAILFMLLAPLVNRYWDQYGAERPFVYATVQILQNAEDPTGTPLIMYDADAVRIIESIWVATIYSSPEELRLFSRRGSGNYSVLEDPPKVWTWFAFFDNEIGAPAPEVPKQPFKICVRFISKADSGVKDESQDFCSNTYTPQLKG